MDSNGHYSFSQQNLDHTVDQFAPFETGGDVGNFQSYDEWAAGQAGVYPFDNPGNAGTAVMSNLQDWDGTASFPGDMNGDNDFATGNFGMQSFQDNSICQFGETYGFDNESFNTGFEGNYQQQSFYHEKSMNESGFGASVAATGIGNVSTFDGFDDPQLGPATSDPRGCFGVDMGSNPSLVGLSDGCYSRPSGNFGQSQQTCEAYHSSPDSIYIQAPFQMSGLNVPPTEVPSGFLEPVARRQSSSTGSQDTCDSVGMASSNDTQAPIVCDWPKCSMQNAFQTENAKSEHIKQTHIAALLIDTSQDCQWPGCEKKTFRTSALRRTHLYNIHIFPLTCRFPGCKTYPKPFSRESDLERHVNSRHNLRPHIFKCPWSDCPNNRKGFARRDKMLAHAKLLGHTAFQCRYNHCNLDHSYTNKDTLELHYSEDHDKYECAIGDCKGSLSQFSKSVLHRHLFQVHYGFWRSELDDDVLTQTLDTSLEGAEDNRVVTHTGLPNRIQLDDGRVLKLDLDCYRCKRRASQATAAGGRDPESGV